jgi:hypothetical protein
METRSSLETLPVVEVRGQLEVTEALTGRREELPHLAGVRHPRGVAEGHLRAAGCREALGDLEDARRGDLALVGAAERDRDDALAAQPFRLRGCDCPLEALQ